MNRQGIPNMFLDLILSEDSSCLAYFGQGSHLWWRNHVLFHILASYTVFSWSGIEISTSWCKRWSYILHILELPFRSSAFPLYNSIGFCLLVASLVSLRIWHSFHLIPWFKELQLGWQNQILRYLVSNVLSRRNYAHYLSGDGFGDATSGW